MNFLKKVFFLLIIFFVVFLWFFIDWFIYNKKYLIILQNDWEARPGGWFYGSVAILKFNWINPNFKIEDAYKYQILAEEKNIFIKTPSYLVNYLETNKIYFLNANISWISKIDLKNIQKIYENITNSKINWVISLNTAWFEKISKQIRNKIREWQFLNVLNYNKKLKSKFDTRKKQYLKDSKKFIKNNLWNLLFLVSRNYSYLVDNQDIQIYIPWYNNLLTKLWLLKNYNKNDFYSFDFYLSFKKASRFIIKTIIIWNKKYINKNIIPLTNNFRWNIEVKYTWNRQLLKEYKIYIKKLEKKYKQNLTSKQLSILDLNWGVNYNLSIFYLPTINFKIPKFCNKHGNIITCIHYLNKKDDIVFVSIHSNVPSRK